MNREQTRRQRILIADDSEMNRSILADMLGDEYDILEAENGAEAVGAIQKYRTEIDLVLLDIVMPEMDGFEVLTVMNRNNWIEDIPVIMISAETAPAHIERAYNLGVTDFITRPFNALVVHRRVVNTTLLYAKQKKLVGMVADQIYEKERQNALMIDILSHIVEFRNGESGQHVLHIRTLTELFLQRLMLTTDAYQLSPMDINMISIASALHDVGKISIPGEILNKPGRFTDEEFAIMKNHTVIGADMMEAVPVRGSEPLIKVARDICRWHHERWDGRGYPDGLKGDAIPISAQIVALADVYDALTSARVYKPPFPHEKAVQMILNGECGAFNPLLMEILEEVAPQLPEHLQDGGEHSTQMEMRSVAQEMHHYEELSASERTLQLLEHERMKYSFFAAMSQEIQFEYTVEPSIVTLNTWGAQRLGLKETVMDPLHNEKVRAVLGEASTEELIRALRNTSPAQPVIRFECKSVHDGEERWCRIIARATWSADEPPQYTGAIGKAVDIHDSQMKLAALERMASHDTLTGLLNHASAKKRIEERIASRPDEQFALAIFDLDHFKNANNTYGHIFGDEVLKFLAGKLQDSIRGADIAARVGGDEFLLFLEYRGELDPIISRIYHTISGCVYEQFPICLSMGIARTDVVGTDYETMFHAADQALYRVKRSGRGRYDFYDESMRDMLSVISPIEGSTDDAGHVSGEEKGEDN
ncbi:MAG: diguanylate cyclase [Oscillospiraceae bacterium]|nr:diguanylate cyclase [Oscillospiraceae bacterium]